MPANLPLHRARDKLGKTERPARRSGRFIPVETARAAQEEGKRIGQRPDSKSGAPKGVVGSNPMPSASVDSPFASGLPPVDRRNPFLISVVKSKLRPGGQDKWLSGAALPWLKAGRKPSRYHLKWTDLRLAEHFDDEGLSVVFWESQHKVLAINQAVVQE